METLNDLLPGIEEFLVSTLASETLSVDAEEKRQYFVERLDILKLPPSIPPRPGRRSCQGSCHGSQNEIDVVDEAADCVPDDFAAYQRELARTFAQVPPPAKKEAKSEHVKIYDDIDSSESSSNEDKEHDLYEIPVVRQSEESGLPCSQLNDSSSLATANSVDDITEEVAEVCPPPPLPPRRDRTASEVTNRSTESIASDKPPDLPSRPPPQSRKSDNNNVSIKKSFKSDKLEKSSDNGITDGDSTSYESYEEEEKANDLALLNKLNIKLPKRAKKESNKLKKKLSNSRSSTQWELNVPFKSLSDVVLSGDLYHKGKLSWNRRLVALVTGNLVCYKPDKETRPNLVISLPGYEATFSERDSKKGFEVKLSHPQCDVHCFSVDFKEWAQVWCDNINRMSQGLPAPGSHQHLARSFIGNSDQTYPSFGGSKQELNSSNSNISNASSDGLSEDTKKPKLRGNKVMRMGSFAYRATQFFENLGKKPSGKRKSPSDPYTDMKAGIEEECSLSSSSSGLPLLTPSSDSHDAVFEDLASPLSSFNDVKHAGYLEVFSSFNKRRWGKRYCLVRENMFECYKTEQSKACELHFLLKPCVLRQATAETRSVYSLMLLEGGKEKITVEVGNKEEMGPWVHVLMRETANESIPEGLEEYFEDNHSSGVLEEKHDFSDLLGYSVIKSWDLASEHYEDKINKEVVMQDVPHENETESKDVYSEVVKKSSTESSFSMALPGIEESVEVFDEQKHTSDSGFVSVRGFNSDSESDSGCAVKSEDESRTYDSKHLISTHLERDSTSREVTPIDSDSRERTLVSEDSNVTSDQTLTDSVGDSENLASVKTEMNPDNICDKMDSVLEDKNCTVNNNIEKETEPGEDFKNVSRDDDENIQLDKTLCEGTDDSNLAENSGIDLDQTVVCNSVSNNESTNHDLLSVKDCIQNLIEHSSDVTETEKSSTTSNFSISEKLEHNSSMVVSSEDDCDNCEVPTSSDQQKPLSNSQKEEISSSDKLKPLSNSQNEDISSTDKLKSLSNSQKEEISSSDKLKPLSNSKTEATSQRLCENTESLGKDKNANDEDSCTEVKSNASSSEATDIQLRIKRLREKLVQIKRKRIAVNDKRKRVETDDEKYLCDEEYSFLEEECKSTDREISQLIENM